MKKVAEYQFLSLLVSGLWNREPEMAAFEMENGAPDWNAIFDLARRQAVLPLVYEGMLKLPENLKPQGDILMKAIAFVDKIEKLNAELDRMSGTVTARLKEKGIVAVLLKGQGTARLYPNPARRQCGDIDLYVGEENYDKALGIVRGWQETTKEMHGSSKHTAFKLGSITLEVHKYAFEMPEAKTEKLYRKLEKRVLDEPVTDILPDGSEVYLPNGAFNNFYVFLHAFHHFMTSGLGLRQLCDMAMILNKYSETIDATEFQIILDEYGLSDVWRTFASLLVSTLKLDNYKAVIYDASYTSASVKLLDIIFEDGNFGHHSSRPDHSGKTPLLRKAGNLVNHHSIAAARLSLFPHYTMVYYRKMWKDGLSNLFSR